MIEEFLMLASFQRAARSAALAVAVLGFFAVPVVYAHENHNELGAGPGPEIETSVAPTHQVEVVEAHENMAVAHEGAMTRHMEAADKNKTFGQRLVSWLGRLHMLVVHFPIAMFVGALGVELFGLWRGNRDYRRAAQVMLAVGAIGAVAAAILGWFAGGFYLTDRNVALMVHRWLGTAIAVAGVLLLYFSSTAERTPDKPRTVYWAMLGIMTIAIAIQGYLGGTFMHGGMNHLAF
jgi:uncharacterized membrane protein